MIDITQGVDNQIVVHLEDYKFEETNTEKVILTIKNEIGGEPIFIKEYTTPAKHITTISAEEAELLYYNKASRKGKAYYDFDAILNDGIRIKITKTEIVNVSRGVGSKDDEDGE